MRGLIVGVLPDLIGGIALLLGVAEAVMAVLVTLYPPLTNLEKVRRVEFLIIIGATEFAAYLVAVTWTKSRERREHEDERDDRILDMAYALAERLDHLVLNVSVAQARLADSLAMNQQPKTLEEMYQPVPGAAEFVQARTRCEMVFKAQHSREVFRLFNRFKKRGIAPQNVTFEMKQRGSFEDIWVIRDDLRAMIRRIDKNNYR